MRLFSSSGVKLESLKMLKICLAAGLVSATMVPAQRKASDPRASKEGQKIAVEGFKESRNDWGFITFLAFVRLS